MRYLKQMSTSIGAAMMMGLLTLATCEASAAPEVVLRVDADAQLTLRVDSLVAEDLDRARYFRLYHYPGMFEQPLVDEMKWLRVVPGRGTGPSFPRSDPRSPEWATAQAAAIERYAAVFRRGAEQHPGASFALAGHLYPRTIDMIGKDDSPDRVDPSMKVDGLVVLPQDYDRVSLILSDWFTGLKRAGAPVPRYFTPTNEPDASWRDGQRSPQSFADFSRVLALRLKQDHPDVRFAGPCTAWSHPGPRWDRWRSPGWVERRFIDVVGDVTDDYDFHLYTKELWAHIPPDPAKIAPGRLQPDARLFESMARGHNEVWDFGKADMMLDLVRVLHRERWDEPAPPVIITEFGRQGITPQLGPWSNPEYFSYLYATTLTRLWMTFMDRPEITLTVPFLLPVSDVGYGDRRGHAMYNRPGAPDDPTPKITPMRDFVAFFRDLEGSRVPADWKGVEPSRQHGMFAIASRTNDTLFVLLHNAPAQPISFTLDLGMQLPQGATLQRMRWDGQTPARFTDPNPADGTWRRDVAPEERVAHTTITLAGEETAILRVPLLEAAKRRVTIERIYAREHLVSLDQPLSFNIQLDAAQLQNATGATAVVGFASPLGGEAGQTLKFVLNGEPLPDTADLGITHGWRAASLPYRVPIPARMLKVGANHLSIMAGDNGVPTDALITTVRLDVRRIEDKAREGH